MTDDAQSGRTGEHAGHPVHEHREGIERHEQQPDTAATLKQGDRTQRCAERLRRTAYRQDGENAQQKVEALAPERVMHKMRQGLLWIGDEE